MHIGESIGELTQALQEEMAGKPGIMGHSSIFQPKIRQGQADYQTPCLRVYVKRKLPKEALRPQDIIVHDIQGVLTDVVEVGDVVAQPFHRLLGQYTARVRPLQPAYSVGHYAITAGTIGGFATDGEHLGILSNNHVLANSASRQNPDRATMWAPTLQPGVYDGGVLGPDIVGWLARWQPLDEEGPNEYDVAWSILVNQMSIKLPWPNIRPARRLRQAETNLEAIKEGRTTGLKRGQVMDTAATIQVSYGTFFTALFIGQILIAPSISAPGDSGSLVLDNDRGAFGLLFAGSDKVTLANHLQAALDGLKLELVGVL